MRGQPVNDSSNTPGFNEAAGAYPADARHRERRSSGRVCECFNEAAGAYPADATVARAEMTDEAIELQ